MLDCVGISAEFKEQEKPESLNTMSQALLILLLSTFQRLIFIAGFKQNICFAASLIFPENCGIIQLLPGANSQGLTELGVASGELLREQIASGEIKGLFIFGEDVPDVDLSGLEFLAVQDLHMTKTAEGAHIVFPATSYAETGGSFTRADGYTQAFGQAVRAKTMSNAAQAAVLAAQAGVSIDAYCTCDSLCECGTTCDCDALCDCESVDACGVGGYSAGACGSAYAHDSGCSCGSTCACDCSPNDYVVIKPQSGCLTVPQSTGLLSAAVQSTNELQVQFMARMLQTSGKV